MGLSERLGQLGRDVKRTIERAGAADKRAGRRGGSVNIARRSNVVSAVNVGQREGAQSVSTHQQVRIKQAGGQVHTTSDPTATVD